MQFQRDKNKVAQLQAALQARAATLVPAQPGSRTLAELFDKDPTRADHLSASLGEIYVDYSKNLIDSETLDTLADLASACGMEHAIQALVNGEPLNHTEQRAALHTALRAQAEQTDQADQIAQSRAALREFVSRVRAKEWLGFDGRPIESIVNLGIGGSDLGPAMVVEALSNYAEDGPRVQFVSNIDPAHLSSALRDLDPATTLFIVASKTFTTQETLANASAARAWLLEAAGGDQDAIAKHFVAATSNGEAANAFGITEDNIFALWDWVGGRFSLWSAIGLPIALAIGFPNFEELLAGAREMDRHFASAEPRKNLPVLLALISFWYRHYFDSTSTAIVPYSQNLSLLPAYLQQLHMESLGKSVDREDRPVASSTSEIIWGSIGSNGQHSYFQHLHQGTQFTPVEFIACATATVDHRDERQSLLLANCLSQGFALMQGNLNTDNPAPHERVAGNKPSTTILLRQLSPHNLGALIALYEHRVFALSVLWNINAFDQWGVELGKRLSKDVYQALTGSQEAASSLDSSTQKLIETLTRWEGDRD